MHRTVRALVLAVSTAAWLVVAATSASADPAGPTNFRTIVTDVVSVDDETVDPEVDVRVVGGDSYLLLDAEGRDVLLRGYDGEELYLRWSADGRVEVNTSAVTYHQNDARYGIGDSQIPEDAGPEVPPTWELVSTDGTYAWHDHRIHWMTPRSLPPNIDPTLHEPQLAYAWPEPILLEVDGRDVAIEGELRWFPDTSPVLAILAALLAAVAVLATARVRPGLTTPVAVSLAALLAGVVGVMENVGRAPGVQGQPLSLVLPGIALVATAAAVATRDRGDAALLLGAVAGVPLVVWAVLHGGAVTAPVLPVDPEWVVRVAVGVTAGVGVAGVLAAGIRLFRTPLVEDVA